MAIVQDQSKPERVLIGFAESLSAPEVVWSLQAAGHRVAVFQRQGAKSAVRRCRDVEVLEISSPEGDLGQSEEELRALIAGRAWSTVLPLDDVSLWLCDRAVRNEAVPLAAPSTAAVAIALDKRQQLAIAESAGLSIPETAYLDAGDTECPQQLPTFPVVVKSSMAVVADTGKMLRPGASICGDMVELRRAIANRPRSVPLMIQPYIGGTGEGLFGFATSCGTVAWSGHRRIRMMNPAGSGSSACTVVQPDSALLAPAERFIASCGWRGLFMIEMLRDYEGRAWFMELNGRSWGSMALARRAGLEYPAWAVAQAKQGDFSPPVIPAVSSLTCRHLGRELIHLLMVLRGPQSVAPVAWPSRFGTLRRVLWVRSGDCWYNCQKGHARLFIEDALHTVVRQLRPRRGA